MTKASRVLVTSPTYQLYRWMKVRMLNWGIHGRLGLQLKF